MVKALGRQLVIELYDCDPRTIDDVALIEKTMLHAAAVSKATIVQSVFHRFSPHGVSGVVIIAESHIAVHTWPEFGYVALDIFTCGETLDAWSGLAFLRSALGAKSSSVTELHRGFVPPRRSESMSAPSVLRP